MLYSPKPYPLKERFMSEYTTETLDELHEAIAGKITLFELEAIARSMCEDVEFVGARDLPRIDRRKPDRFKKNLELWVADQALARGAGQWDLPIRGYTWNAPHIQEVFWNIWETNYHPLLCDPDLDVPFSRLLGDFIDVFFPRGLHEYNDYEWWNNNHGHVNLETITLEYTKAKSEVPIFDRKGFVIDPEFWVDHMSAQQKLEEELAALEVEDQQDASSFQGKLVLTTIAGLASVGMVYRMRAKRGI